MRSPVTSRDEAIRFLFPKPRTCSVKTFLQAVVLGALALVAHVGVAEAQVAMSVSLLTKEQFGRSDIIGIVRVDQAKFPQPIIAIKRSALTPDLLMAALEVLNSARQKFGDTTTKRINFEFTTKSRVRRARPQDVAWASEIVASLVAQPERSVNLVGRARALVVSLPVIP
jgi:hypothetical protein